MKFRNRILARAGAAVLLASGAVAALAAPGYAATATDLELTVVGTKIAANGEAKTGWAKITNKGGNTPSGVTIVADASAVDDRVHIIPAIDRCTATDDQPRRWTCALPKNEIPGPGETVDVELILFTFESGLAPYRAPVTYTISSPDDTNEENNSKTVDVVFSQESGVDLGVLVPDVKEAVSEPKMPGRALRAGDTTVVWGWVYNWGNLVANGVQVTVRLPENVTFAEAEADCAYSADNRRATCAYRTVAVTPIPVAGGDEDVVSPAVAGWCW